MRFLAHYTVYNGLVLHLNVVDLNEGKVDYFAVKEETAHTLFIEGILLICNELNAENLNCINKDLEQIGIKPVKEIAETININLANYKIDKKARLCAYQIKDISLERYYISKLI